jgi:molecular chaperone DnaK (HSP70)
MRIGIDLGTTYSLTAMLNPHGVPLLLSDAQEKDLFHTPSSVCLTPDGALVGHMAETLHATRPELPLMRFFKRHFGEDKSLCFDTKGQEWFPEGIAALVLKKLKMDARRAMPGREVESAVITVPAHFDDRQRKAVLAAAALAELPTPNLVEEPVAAALHYGVKSRSHEQLLVVYDLGGGTFDVTILTMGSQEVRVLAKDGLTALGGKEFDEALIAIVLAQFEQTLGTPLSPDALDAQGLLQLRRQAEELKIRLCMPGCDRIAELVPLGQEAIEVQITRREFEAAVRDYIENTEHVTLRCLDSASLKPRDVQTLLLVGGSSMMPLIGERMRQLFNQPGQQVLFNDPTKAVAFGAALHACQLSGEADRYQIPPVLRGVTGYHVGVEVFDARTGQVTVDPLIKKNMPLPAKAPRRTYYADPSQDKVVFDIVQYLDDPRQATSRGQLVIDSLPPHQQSYPIEVEISNLEDGTLDVRAHVPHTRQPVKHTFGQNSQEGQAHLARQRALVRSTPVNGLL